ncbi:MAG: YdcF family protein, partial [Pyrinomonadaceae bacterium]|nr:YdcF family protein [Pyrinomonadaceae bacterium]
MFSADIHPTSALSLTDARKMRVWRIVRFAALTLVSWSLLAWGAAAALITRAELPRADAIVVLSNARAYTERTHHAAQLWKEGRAPRVLLTNENLRSSWSEGQQRNPFFYERATEELKRVGVRPEKIEVLPDAVGSTYQEAVLLRKFAAQHNLHSILIVTSAYHSRRALWTFRQVFAGTGVDVGLDAPAPGQQTPHPATWWLRPSGWTTVALEYPKLIYYWARYRAYVDATSSYDSASSSTVQAKTTVGESRAGLTLSLTAPTIAYVNEVILIDARNSAGVSRKPQANGTTSVRIDFGDGFTCDLLACGHAYRAAGTYTIILSAKNDKGIAAIPVSASIQVGEIPSATGLNSNNGARQNVIDMTNPIGNAAYYIAPSAYRSASANAARLQNAINLAAANNSTEREIILPAGAVFAGPIILPTPVGNRYITIRS